MRKLVPALAACIFLGACTSATNQSSSNAAAKEPPKHYQLHGEVTAVDPQAKTATINGQKIEGWMDAMKMDYPVKDAQDFSTLHPNDCIDATIFVQGTDYWVGEVKHAQAEPGACMQKK